MRFYEGGNYRRQDMGFVLLLFVLSAMMYAGRLGFYSDDWSFLYAIQSKSEPSLMGSLTRIVREDLPSRPGQAILLVTMYRAFGAVPLPFHLFNALVLAGACVLFLRVLQRVGVPRTMAVASAALYALLPQYSTDRFWVAAMQAPISMLLFLGCVVSGLNASETASARGRAGWGCAAIAALAASILCYEVVVPLAPLAVWLWLRQARTRGTARPAILATATMVALVALSAYKATVTTRMDHENGWYPYARWIVRTAVSPHYSPANGGFNIHWAVFTNFVQNGFLLPWSAWRVAREMQWAGLATAGSVALAVGALLFWYTRRLVRNEGLTEWNAAKRFVIAGLMVFLLGYAIFLTNGNVQFTPTGIANRTAIAAALGVAIFLAGISVLAALLTPLRWRATAYSFLIAVAGASGCFLVNGLADFWAGAYSRELAVLEGVTNASTDGPPGKTVLLDGICPYAGPAPVFESSWDFSGALAFQYKTASLLEGHVVSPDLTVGPSAFVVRHYTIEYRYPYGPGTAIYNARTGRVYPIPDETAARRYFSGVNTDLTNGCPAFSAGLGVRLY